MESGGWIVVLVILALAITTGFVVSTNSQLALENQTAHTALEGSVEMVATFSAQATNDADKIKQMETKVVKLEATQTAEHTTRLQKEQEMQAALNAAQADRVNAQATITAQEIALASINTPEAVEPCEPQAGAFGPTPMPVAMIQESQAGMSLLWLPTLGFGLFSAAAVAVYRMVKMEDQTRRGSGKAARRVAGDRMYQADEDAVYVKMSRREASRYARERVKK